MAKNARGFVVIDPQIHAAVKKQAEQEQRTLRVVFERYALEGLARDAKRDAKKPAAA